MKQGLVKSKKYIQELEDRILKIQEGNPAVKGKMNVHWKQIFKSNMFYHLQRVLRDQGAMNKEVGDAFEFAFEEVAKDYAIVPIKTPTRTDMSEWISVKDRLPEIGTEVIAWSPKSYTGLGQGRVTALCRLIRYEEATEFYWANHYPGNSNIHTQEAITHWMPLPEPPKN